MGRYNFWVDMAFGSFSIRAVIGVCIERDSNTIGVVSFPEAELEWKRQTIAAHVPPCQLCCSALDKNARNAQRFVSALKLFPAVMIRPSRIPPDKVLSSVL